jgi:DNA adenine methylase
MNRGALCHAEDSNINLKASFLTSDFDGLTASVIVRFVLSRAIKRGDRNRNRADDLVLRSPGPPLKWAGGKRWLVPHIEPLWREHRERRYVELFCGGLAVALGLKPKRAVLNDLNPHLINFYAQLRRGLSMKIDARYDEDLFYTHRARFNQLIKDGGAGTAEAAQIFYYLNRTCFNGLCRFNQSGEFNVPFGQYKKVNYATDFAEYREAFSAWSFRNRDLAKLSIKPDDFIYADPPYDVLYSRVRACV